EVIKSRARTISRSLPVVAAAHSGAHLVSFFGRILAGDQAGTSIVADAVGPGDLSVAATRQHLAGGPIERIEEAVAIGLYDRLDLLAFDLQVHQDWIGDCVPIVQVVGGELVMPSELACIGVQSHQAARV